MPRSDFLAWQVRLCNEGHKNCGERGFCGTKLTTDTKEPYCLECGYHSSSCANNFNPGWVALNETCNTNSSCLRSFESVDCFSVFCDNNVCKENPDYQQCFNEEYKWIEWIKWIGIACGIIIAVVLVIGCICFCCGSLALVCFS